MLKCLCKGNNGIFEGSKETSKVRCMYLAFKSLKISNKEGQEWLQTKNQTTADIFRG